MNEDDAEGTTAAPVPDTTDPGRRRYYMTDNQLDPTLWSVGYRTCTSCSGLTIHRLVCLRCDPTDASRIEPVPQEDVA